MDTRFHCVYLLTSLDPRCEGQFYIGYTVNPLRRLRQHNGELVNGARRTSRSGRPWTLVCCVSGFPEDRAALKFEWSWQNPRTSARLKRTVPHALAGLTRLPLAVGTLHYLLHTDLFNRLQLKLHIFERDIFHGAAATAIAHAERGGTRRGPRVLSQVANLSDELTERASPTSVLPALTPSHLFSIEETTREAFEDTYLAHDRCLARQLAEVNSLQELSVLSCPFDVSALSQMVQEEGSSSRSRDTDQSSHCSSGGAMCEDGHEPDKNTNGHDYGRERSSFSLTSTESPEALTLPQTHALFHGHATTTTGTQCDLQRETEEVEDNVEMELLCAPTTQTSLTSRPLVSSRFPQRSASTPAKTRPWPAATTTTTTASMSTVTTAPAAAMTKESEGVEACEKTITERHAFFTVPERWPSAEQATAGRSASVPLALSTSPGSVSGLESDALAFTGCEEVVRAQMRPAVATATASSSPARIPRRFRHYKDTDFVRDHVEEQTRLESGMLPCTLCALPLHAPYVLRCTRAPFCSLYAHLTCLALWAHAEATVGSAGDAAEPSTATPTAITTMTTTNVKHGTANGAAAAVAKSSPACVRVGVPAPLSLVPTAPFACPLCRTALHWSSLVKALKQRAVTHQALQAQRRRLQSQAVWETRLATMTAAHQRQCRARPQLPAPQGTIRSGDIDAFSAPAPNTAQPAAQKRARAETPPPVPSTPALATRTGAEEVGLALTQFDPSEW